MRRKLQDIAAEHERLGARMGDPEVASKPALFREAARSHAELSPTVARFRSFLRDEEHLAGTRSMLEGETDPELCAMAREDQVNLEHALAEHEKALQLLLIPKDPNDSKNTILKIRAGTGGDEAALFSADLHRA